MNLWAMMAVFLISSVSLAQETPPHSKLEAGELHGTLYKDGRPQGGKQVVIQVQQDGQTLLTLPKQTDKKGSFVFKNIFRDPKFSYTLLAEHDGKIYRHGPLQLPAKQDVLHVRFDIRPENAVEMNAAPMPPESPQNMPVRKVQGQWQQHQIMSLILSACILTVLAYVLGRYQRKK